MKPIGRGEVDQVVPPSSVEDEAAPTKGTALPELTLLLGPAATTRQDVAVVQASCMGSLVAVSSFGPA